MHRQSFDVSESRNPFPTSTAGRTLPVLAVSLCLMGSLALPATADILVMKDGSSIETKGPWRDRGRIIEFTMANGTLGSVRSSEVDLTASEEATTAAEEAAARADEPKVEEPKKPVAVWTDKDIPQASPDVVDAERGALAQEAVRVVDYTTRPGVGDDVVVAIEGTVQNYGGGTVTGVALTVTVDGDRSGPVRPRIIREARLESSTLAQGEATTFRLEIFESDVSPVGGNEEFVSPDVSFELTFRSGEADDDGAGAGGADDDV